MNMKLDYIFNPPTFKVSRMKGLNVESDSTKIKILRDIPLFITNCVLEYIQCDNKNKSNYYF